MIHMAALGDGAERLALLYSDGSIGILRAGCTLEEAREEARFLDPEEHDVSRSAKVAVVRVHVVEII